MAHLDHAARLSKDMALHITNQFSDVVKRTASAIEDPGVLIAATVLASARMVTVAAALLEEVAPEEQRETGRVSLMALFLDELDVELTRIVTNFTVEELKLEPTGGDDDCEHSWTVTKTDGKVTGVSCNRCSATASVAAEAASSSQHGG